MVVLPAPDSPVNQSVNPLCSNVAPIEFGMIGLVRVSQCAATYESEMTSKHQC